MNKNIKVLLQLLLVLFLLVGVNVQADVNEDNWTKVGGNNTNSKVITSDTIKSNADVGKRITIKGGYREAIIIDDIIYVVNGAPLDVSNPNGTTAKATLEAFDLNGKKLKTIALNDSVGFFSRLAYDGDSTIFVSLSKNIQAVDIKNNKSLWVSKSDSKQMLSQMVYHDGYLYGGAVTEANASDTPSSGYYYAIDTSKKIGAKEEMPYAWTWGEDNKTGNGFYWDGAAIVKDSIVFVGDRGRVVSHALKSDTVYDTYDLTSSVSGTHKVRSLVYYNDVKDELLIGTQNSKKIFNIKMDGNKFAKSSIKYVNAPDQISGGINLSNKNNGNLYVSSGGMYANAFSILSNDLSKVKYTTKDYGTQSFPLINVAKKDGYEYTYFIDYKSGDMIIAKYNGSGTPKFERVVLPETGKSPAYNSGSVIAANEGTIVATKHDGGALFIIKNKNTYAQTEVDKLNVAITNLLAKKITTGSYSSLISLKNRYDKLSTANKKLVVGYKDLDKAIKGLDGVKSSVKSGKTTYYYKFKTTDKKASANGKWFHYQTITKSTKSKVTTTTTLTYKYTSAKMKSTAKKPLNGATIAKKSIITKKPGIITGKKYYTYNSKGKLTKLLNYKLNKNYRFVLVNKQTKSYYSNAKVKNHYTYNKSLTTNKYTSKSRIYYNSKGKRVKKISFSYKKGKASKRVEYAYNKKGQLKSNKYGKAYRYTTTYKNGKKVKTLRQQYSSGGKLAKKSVKVKLRTSF